jgi:hypothetical protein
MIVEGETHPRDGRIPPPRRKGDRPDERHRPARGQPAHSLIEGREVEELVERLFGRRYHRARGRAAAPSAGDCGQQKPGGNRASEQD